MALLSHTFNDQLDQRLEVIELALSQQKMQVDCKTEWDYVSLH